TKPAAARPWRQSSRSAGMGPVVVIGSATAVTPVAGDRAADTAAREDLSRDGIGENAALSVVTAIVLCSRVPGFDSHEFGNVRTVNRLSSSVDSNVQKTAICARHANHGAARQLRWNRIGR